MRKILLSVLLLTTVFLSGCVHVLPEEDGIGTVPGGTTVAETEHTTVTEPGNTTESGTSSGTDPQETEKDTAAENTAPPDVTDDGYTKLY